MRLIIILTLFAFQTCTSFHPYTSGWKRSAGNEIFYAGIMGEASEKAISTNSVSMKQRTCTEAAKNTSGNFFKYLVEAEKQSLEKAELDHLGKIVSAYNIKPVLIECQAATSESAFGGVDWASCQCLFSLDYPGGRTQFQRDLMQAR